MDVTTSLSSQISGASAHVDVINPSDSTAVGWLPTYTATANVTEKAQVGLTTSFDITAELEVSLFGGLLDLSTGVKASPKFPVEFTVAATESVTASTEDGTVTGSASLPSDTETCQNGVDIDVNFALTVTAFATKWMTATLYEYTNDIFSECYTWF